MPALKRALTFVSRPPPNTKPVQVESVPKAGACPLGPPLRAKIARMDWSRHNSEAARSVQEVVVEGEAEPERWCEWMGRVEAAIFASPTPVPREMLAALVGPGCRLDDLIADIQDELRARPYELVFAAGGWRLQTRGRFGDALRIAGLLEDGVRDALTRAEMLALAAIAYAQPATRADLSRLLGRQVSRDVLARLKRATLIAAGPRLPALGAPLTYVTTDAFLSLFGLGSLRDLPDLETFEAAAYHEKEQLAGVEAGELDDAPGLTQDVNAE